MKFFDLKPLAEDGVNAVDLRGVQQTHNLVPPVHKKATGLLG